MIYTAKNATSPPTHAIARFFDLALTSRSRSETTYAIISGIKRQENTFVKTDNMINTPVNNMFLRLKKINDSIIKYIMMLSNIQRIELDAITNGHKNHIMKAISDFRLSPVMSITSL